MDSSGLLRFSDYGSRRQCCVGIYLTALEVKDAQLQGRGTAHSVRLLPKQAQWLIKDFGPSDSSPDSSEDAALLYGANDNRHMDETVRETRVAELFCRNGVNVTFTD